MRLMSAQLEWQHTHSGNYVLCKFVGEISEQRFLEKLNCMKCRQMPKEKV